MVHSRAMIFLRQYSYKSVTDLLYDEHIVADKLYSYFFVLRRITQQKAAFTNKKATARVAVSCVGGGGGRSRPSLAFAALMLPCISDSNRVTRVQNFNIIRQNKKGHLGVTLFLLFGGGGGNRTRVRKSSAIGSTCLSTSISLTTSYPTGRED